MQIRLATLDDAPAILEIYAHYCRMKPATFELEPPALDEMEKRIRETLLTYPWLVAVDQNRILGYAYACAFRPRKGWRWAAETAIYLTEDSLRQGIGSALYEKLLAMLKAQGFISAIANITLPNPASERLHERFGFEKIGVFKNIGYKCDSWHNVAFFQLTLNSPNPVPREPLHLIEIAELV